MSQYSNIQIQIQTNTGKILLYWKKEKISYRPFCHNLETEDILFRTIDWS